MTKSMFLLFALAALLTLSALPASAQTTAFKYQGSLSTSGTPASGSFDMEFALFDAVAAGSQLGPTVTLNGIAVSDGIFSVTLDFGNQFPGAARFLEIRVRQTGGGAFTPLTPRQALASTPYAINAAQLGGVAASQFVQTGDPRLTDARTPTAGSPSYIQNSTTLQAASNFYISGNGRLGGRLWENEVASTTGFYQIQFTEPSPNLVFHNPGNSLYIGGSQSRTGAFTLQVGHRAGNSNDGARFNAFIGAQAGQENTTGERNVFVGYSSGDSNTTGSRNTFVGRLAGWANLTGSNNAAIGEGADVATGALNFATAIGSGAIVPTSNTIMLGRANGSDTVRVPGKIILIGLGTGGSTALCRNGLILGPEISTCSSSLRYKENISSFGSGLDLIRRLNPITFDWKQDGMRDLGLGAEDVAEIEPLLVTYNANGEVEGVKYDRIGVVLINVVKEQQKQIERQNEEINELRAALCQMNPGLALCTRSK